MLERFRAQGLLKARGQQRTDSTHVLAAIRTLNRLECVGETLRAALNSLATVAPEWLCEHLAPEWFDRYSTRIEDSRLPKGKEARKDYAEVIGADGSRLLTALYDPSAPPYLRELPVVQNLRRIWTFHYYAEEGQLCWRKAEDLPPAGMRFDSPYDLDARFGNKRSITWTGFKVHLTETRRGIRKSILSLMSRQPPPGSPIASFLLPSMTRSRRKLFCPVNTSWMLGMSMPTCW